MVTDVPLRKWKVGPGILEDDKIKHSVGLSVGSNLITHPEAQSFFRILSMLPAGTTCDKGNAGYF
jgi:hypothetical protein